MGPRVELGWDRSTTEQAGMELGAWALNRRCLWSWARELEFLNRLGMVSGSLGAEQEEFVVLGRE